MKIGSLEVTKRRKWDGWTIWMIRITEDMKIGMENFKKNGPKIKAEFVHR